jgi:hypothetical protein
MATIKTRETTASGVTNKNAPLTNAEIDANFINLNNDKLEIGDATSSNTADTVVKRDGAGGFSMAALSASSLTLGTDLPITEGGTGASTAAGARTNLGLAIGTNVQAYDVDLASFAGLTTTGIVVRTGNGSIVTRTLAAGTGVTLTNADGVGGTPTITNSGVTSFNGLTGAITGFSGATGGGSDAAFFLNDVLITSNYSIPSNKNAMTAGPVTVQNGVTVTVPSGSTWTIV